MSVNAKKKISVNAKNICIYISVNARKKMKSGWDFSFPSHTRIHPNFPPLLSDFAAQKSSHFSYFLGCISSEVQPSFSTPFPLSLFFFLSSSFASTRQPSLSHQHKISLSKEEIKELILKFQLQIVGGK